METGTRARVSIILCVGKQSSEVVEYGEIERATSFLFIAGSGLSARVSMRVFHVATTPTNVPIAWTRDCLLSQGRNYRWRRVPHRARWWTDAATGSRRKSPAQKGGERPFVARFDAKASVNRRRTKNCTRFEGARRPPHSHYHANSHIDAHTNKRSCLGYPRPLRAFHRKHNSLSLSLSLSVYIACLAKKYSVRKFVMKFLEKFFLHGEKLRRREGFVCKLFSNEMRGMDRRRWWAS